MTRLAKIPSISILNEHFAYDPETGAMKWKCGRNAGTKAGTITKSGYVQISILGRVYRAHRLIWMMSYGREPDGFIDHINGIGTDNRLINLREVSHLENLRNAKRPRHNTSGKVGVMRSRDRWRAQISINGRCIHLGCFPSFEMAAEARRKAENRYGFHENHGRIMAGDVR